MEFAKRRRVSSKNKPSTIRKPLRGGKKGKTKNTPAMRHSPQKGCKHRRYRRNNQPEKSNRPLHTARFQERGISGKDAIKQTGRPAFLTLKQRKDLVKQLEKGPPRNRTGLWSTKEVQEYIKEKYGVEYTNVHMWELLKALGFTFQRPRPRHHKALTRRSSSGLKKSFLAGVLLSRRGFGSWLRRRSYLWSSAHYSAWLV